MFTLISSDDIFRSHLGADLYRTASLLEGTEYFRTHSPRVRTAALQRGC